MIPRERMPAVLVLICSLQFGLLLKEAAQAGSSPPAEDYILYDQVIEKKFLTAHTRLVLLERMTVFKILPGQKEPTTTAFFEGQELFDQALPHDLIRDFVAVNQESGRLEGRFRFGLPYRFVSGNTVEEPEVLLALPVTVGRDSLPAVLDRLAFSRVGRTLRNDQALVYVENTRPDGAGAGFLIWFRRQGHDWRIADTEVLWVAHDQEGGEFP